MIKRIYTFNDFHVQKIIVCVRKKCIKSDIDLRFEYNYFTLNSKYQEYMIGRWREPTRQILIK